MRSGELSERGADDALIGRESEVSALLSLFSESASQRAARGAVVLGPPGIGKSRLAHEIAKLAAERGAAVWLGRGDPDGRPAPFGVIGDLLHRLAGVEPGEPIATRRARLRERVGRHLEQDILWETAAVLGEAIGTPLIEEGGADSGPAAGGSVLLADLTLRAWEDLLEAELARSPIALFVDDAQWADTPSMRLIEASLRNLSNRALFVVALGEAPLLKAFPGLFSAAGALEIRLGELSDTAARRLIGSITGNELSEASVEALAARGGGNPFVLEGIAREARSPDAAISSGSGEQPQTVLGVAAARFGACLPETRQMLRAASVLGDVVSRADLLALLEGTMDASAAERAIRDAIARDLLALRAGVAPPGNELWFRSAAGRHVAYASFSPEDRARAHLLAGHRLKDGERDPTVSAWHFQHGGAPELAIEPYRMAALRALAANDFGTAIARAKQAEACGAEGTTLGEVARILADAHVWRGENELAAREAQRAMSLVAPSASWFQAAAAYGVCSSRLANTPALHATARDVESLVVSRPSSSVDPALRVAQVTAMSRIAIALLHGGEGAAAEPMLGRLHALHLAGALDGLPFALGQAHRAFAVWAHMRGQILQAFLAFDAAAASFERAGALRDACVDQANAGFMKTELGQNEEAEKRLSAALATAMRLGLAAVAASAQLNLSLLMTRRRAGFPASAMGETALGMFEKQGSTRMIMISLVYLSRALLMGGAPATALARARRAVDFADDVPLYRAYAFAALSATELSLGHVAEALQGAETAMKAMREVGLEEGEMYVRLTHVQALEAAERFAEAKGALAEADATLAARAATISEPSHREAFLRNIPEHAHIVELAEAAGVGATARAPTMLPGE